MSDVRILGVTEREMLTELRDYQVDGIPASGPYRSTIALTTTVVALLGFDPGRHIRKSDVRAAVRVLFAR